MKAVRLISLGFIVVLAAMLIGTMLPRPSIGAETPKVEASEQEQLKLIIAGLQQNLRAALEQQEPLKRPIYEAYHRALISEYERQIVARAQTSRAFDWNYWACWVSLWLVVFIVVAGIGFCGYQLKLAGTVGTQAETNFEVDAQGKLKLQTSAVGIVVLVISLAFFYLFLIKVFDMKVVDVRVPTVSEKAPAAKPSA